MEIKHNAQTFYPQYFRQPVFCVLNSNRLMLQWYLQKTLEQFALNCAVRIKPPVRRLTWPRSSRLNLDLLLSQYSFQWQRKSVLDMTVIICALWKAFTCTKSQNLTLKRYKFVALGWIMKTSSHSHTLTKFTKQGSTELWHSFLTGTKWS